MIGWQAGRACSVPEVRDRPRDNPANEFVWIIRRTSSSSSAPILLRLDIDPTLL